MAKKANGRAKIELEILNPAQFKTLQEIRDFVTGDGASVLRFAIGGALIPGEVTGQTSEIEDILKDQMKDARQAALYVNQDLGTLAKAAVELERDPHVAASVDFNLDKEKRALRFIALMDGDACPWVKQGISEQLGGASA